MSSVMESYPRTKKLLDSARGFVWDVYRHKRVSLHPSGQAKGNVLLSYITMPFVRKPDDPLFKVHSNFWECKTIAATFLDLGYNVDVIDYDDSDFIPKKDYSVVVDIHSNLERLAPRLGKDCVKILHITGAHWLHQNMAEYARLKALQVRRGATLIPRRIVPPSKSIEVADAATLLGNEFTLGTWRFAKKPIYRIPISSPVTFPWDGSKDFGRCGNRFLWLGSTGLVLKGLDLVLEAFAGLPDHHLTVCGPIDREKDFEKEYARELYNTRNIQTIGWVDTSSQKFAEIVHNSAAVVYASASEGGGTGVVVCLHAGLIPIVSVESSVDVAGFGHVLSECSVEEIRRCVKSLAKMPASELARMAKAAWEFARERHTREAFSREYRRAVAGILESKGIS